MTQGSLVISLDFELHWGVRDQRSVASYKRNLDGVRQAIPAMLASFERHRVHATFATVGMLAFSNKRDLLAALPTIRPMYQDPNLDPYRVLSHIGDDEDEDPYHYGLNLIRLIQDTPGMEIGSHTFSHYYWLEPGTSAVSLREDLLAAQSAFERLDIKATSLVFPRNQYDDEALAVVDSVGLRAYRGNLEHPFYLTQREAEESHVKRLGRLTDAYLNLSGHNGAPRVSETQASRLVDVRASRFLRPHSQKLRALEPLRLDRIKQSMTQCAKQGLNYHLWWHPHNFGADTEVNMRVLDLILDHFEVLRETFGMRSLTMSEAACSSQ